MDVDLKRVMVLVIFSIVVLTCHGEPDEDHIASLFSDEETIDPPFLEDSDTSTEKAAQMIEELSISAEKSASATDNSNIYYESMARVLDDIIYAVRDRTHAYKFLKAKGLHRVIAANIGVDHVEMRTKLLVLLKTLFETAPVTTNAFIPKSIVTKLLDIFENNQNLALKAHALDILHKWLPNNPEIQMRVMKMKGLEPFYSQIDKLDISVIQTLLELFNTILLEHIEMRNVKVEVTKMDHDRKVMYQRIGLLERMETSNVCNGLVKIFQIVWAYNDNGAVVKIVLELVKNIKPFCTELLKGRANAIALFENLLKFVMNEDQMPLFEEIGIDAVKYQVILEEYVDKLKIDRDEF